MVHKELGSNSFFFFTIYASEKCLSIGVWQMNKYIHTVKQLQKLNVDPYL